MKTSTRIILASTLSMFMAVPAVTWAQDRQAAGRTTSAQTSRPVTHSNSNSTISNGRQNNSSGNSGSRPAVSNTPTSGQATQTKPAVTRPTNQTHVTGSGNQQTVTTRPQVTNPSGTTSRPNTTPPSNNQNRPNVTPPSNNQSRPNVTPPSNNQNRPNVTPPANNQSKPNLNSTGRQPAQNNRPGNAANPGANRPGNPVKPGANRPTTPAYRPDINRPHNNFLRPDYRPPRPGGGFWAAPPVNVYRPVFYRPVPPPRPVTFGVGIPVLNNILGLTFGSFIDLGINTLFNAGYNVLGYANNIIYLGNVNQIGYIWPEASVYYTDGLMSNTQFQYWTTYPSSSRFDNVYVNLTRTYGPPVNNFYENAVRTVSWWAGGGTGYITLQYGPGLADNGRTYYYTTLTYSDYY